MYFAPLKEPYRDLTGSQWTEHHCSRQHHSEPVLSFWSATFSTSVVHSNHWNAFIYLDKMNPFQAHLALCILHWKIVCASYFFPFMYTSLYDPVAQNYKILCDNLMFSVKIGLRLCVCALCTHLWQSNLMIMVTVGMWCHQQQGPSGTWVFGRKETDGDGRLHTCAFCIHLCAKQI